MNKHDLLEAIGHVSEENVDRYALPHKALEPAEPQADTPKPAKAAGKERITMKTNTHTKQKPKKTIEIHAGAAVAVVAVCLALHAAVIFGMAQMRKDPALNPGAAMSGEIQEIGTAHMTLEDAMPTGVQFLIETDNGESVVYNPVFIIAQNGKKIADTELTSKTANYTQTAGTIAEGIVRFEQLPAGSYTLVNVSADGTHEGNLGHLDFEISDEFDAMVWIPSVSGEPYETASAKLAEYPVNFKRRDVSVQDVEPGIVYDMEIDPYRIERDENGAETWYTHYDGAGFWVTKNSTVEILVSAGAGPNERSVMVPDVTGWDFETAKSTLLGLGLYVDKRTAFSNAVPEGKVIEVSVNAQRVDGQGISVDAGSYVKVVVSLGINPETVPVSNFTLMQFSAAKEAAETLGFIVEKEYEPNSAPVGVFSAVE